MYPTEVTARAHIARLRLGLVLRKCPEIPPEHMQGGESLAAQKLRRRRAASGAVFATGNPNRRGATHERRPTTIYTRAAPLEREMASQPDTQACSAPTRHG